MRAALPSGAFVVSGLGSTAAPILVSRRLSSGLETGGCTLSTCSARMPLHVGIEVRMGLHKSRSIIQCE